MTVLIPSYKPDEHMVDTVSRLRAADPSLRVLVVDDGSGEEYRRFFDEAAQAGAEVIRHEKNRGKGAALKTGFARLKENGETEGCVCADADGQHLTEDILKVARAVREHPSALIIGGRKFSEPGVPLRSKAGNYATRFTFNLLCGQCLGDTQTGLRGIPASRLDDMLSIPGDRYEYEMRQLLRARQMDLELIEVAISTVYLDAENSASHFNPLRDAARVYLPVLAAGLGLILAAAADIALFFTLFPLIGLIPAAFAARGAAMLIRGADLLIRRGRRRFPWAKACDFIACGIFAAAFSAFFAYCLAPVAPGFSPALLKLFGDIVVVAYICVLRAIKIRRVK